MGSRGWLAEAAAAATGSATAEAEVAATGSATAEAEAAAAGSVTVEAEAAARPACGGGRGGCSGVRGIKFYFHRLGWVAGNRSCHCPPSSSRRPRC
ncbi:Os06g0292800 [Oryza sativa Japonica Group]|uniref:Os06g0292800 protein n=1 Tax=Oryza sativa subsp. japonica TaxID=39947 RepID=A0A0P0WVI5_ORYSJ|nr:Os06g0292800 [Oryza sativa Japonica Group]